MELVIAIRICAAFGIIFLMAAMVFESTVADTFDPGVARRAHAFATAAFFVFVVFFSTALILFGYLQMESP